MTHLAIILTKNITVKKMSAPILPFWQGCNPSEFQMGPRDVLAFGWQVKIRSFWKSNDLLVGPTGAL